MPKTIINTGIEDKVHLVENVLYFFFVLYVFFGYIKYIIGEDFIEEV